MTRYGDGLVLFLAHRLDATTLVPALVGALVGDSTDGSMIGHRLVLLTANEDAPPILYPKSSEDYKTIREYWVRWWEQHGPTFVTPGASEREAAMRRWTARGPGVSRSRSSP
jgi:hypothetical protein